MAENGTGTGTGGSIVDFSSVQLDGSEEGTEERRLCVHLSAFDLIAVHDAVCSEYIKSCGIVGQCLSVIETELQCLT